MFVTKRKHKVDEKTENDNTVEPQRLKTATVSALLVARNKPSYTTVESLIMPGALILAYKMLDKKTANAIKTIQSSDTTPHCTIHDMAQDAVEQITVNVKLDKRFAIQTDESMEVSDEAELLVYIKYFYVKKWAIVEEILDVNNYQNIQWKKIFLKSLTSIVACICEKLILKSATNTASYINKASS